MGNREYRFRTTEDLIKTYAWLNDRYCCNADANDINKVKKLIKSEIERRFSAVLKFLDDGQNDENPDGTMRYLLGE